MKPQAEAKRAVKVEKACQLLISGKTQTDAYRAVFKPKRAKPRTVNDMASKFFKLPDVTHRLAELLEPIKQETEWTLAERLKELRCAGQLDPIDFVDEHNLPRAMRDIPERARRAITSIEIDPEKFITKIKFDSKRGSVMDYTKLAGDMPVEKHEITAHITLEALILASMEVHDAKT